ncbi:hypothetical protein N665_0663s0021 [Sinapis alba]|nr:hypothetical protein N665_0663s0021 [Sinapis alba]
MANSWVSLYFALMKKSVGVIHGFIPAARTTHYRFRKECFRGRRSLLSDLAGTRIQKLFEKFESILFLNYLIYSVYLMVPFLTFVKICHMVY